MSNITNRPLTTVDVENSGSNFNLSAIDSRIVKIRPSSTPIDQISRMCGSRHAGSMKVEYYTVDTKPTEGLVAQKLVREDDQIFSGSSPAYNLKVNNSQIFDASETIFFPDLVNGAEKGLVAYISSIGEDNKIVIMPVGTELKTDIPANTRIVRMGRAATELDVQSPQFQALPDRKSNNCQIFKMQVEQSTLQRLSNKEIDWTLSDQEEAAVIDMRLGMEKSFLFGKQSRLDDPNKHEPVYFTNGIWNQGAGQYSFDVATLDNAKLIDICAKAFTNNNGSKNRILLAGTGLVSAISKLTVDRVLQVGNPKAKWGIEAREIVSNFGKLYLIHSEIFDQCGHFNDGFILDPNYITKYTHIPFNAESLDLRRSGQRNTEAVVLTEASCLVLRYPKSHLKLINSNASAATSLA